MPDNTILVTGAAGFIGFHVASQLMAEGRDVIGLDNLKGPYDPALKLARLEILRANSRFSFLQADLADRPLMASLFAKHRFALVVHLAAQAGVRHSIDHPHAYVDSNLDGFVNVLEGCRHNDCRHLIYASSSSVYRDQKGQRVDGSFLQPPLPASGHRAAVFYHLRAMGSARYGSFSVCQGDR